MNFKKIVSVTGALALATGYNAYKVAKNEVPQG